jgi:hypothetical protein
MDSRVLEDLEVEHVRFEPTRIGFAAIIVLDASRNYLDEYKLTEVYQELRKLAESWSVNGASYTVEVTFEFNLATETLQIVYKIHKIKDVMDEREQEELRRLFDPENEQCVSVDVRIFTTPNDSITRLVMVTHDREVFEMLHRADQEAQGFDGFEVEFPYPSSPGNYHISVTFTQNDNYDLPGDLEEAIDTLTEDLEVGFHVLSVTAPH